MTTFSTNPPAKPPAGSAAPNTGIADNADWAEPRQHLGWRILLTLVLLLLVALFSLLLQTNRVRAAPPAQSASGPLVLAFYYTWFDENTWNSGQLSDLPAERYASADRGAMGRHIDQAKAAGIDAFVVAWYGPNGDTNQTEANLRTLLDEAAARNFRIGILFETDSPFLGGPDSATAALQHALGVHANHPAYLRADGKPVVFFWRSSLYGVGTWASIRSQADPGYGSLWIGEGVDTSHLSVFDGHYLYSNTWNPPADLSATNQKFAARVAAMREATGAAKLWVATVMPGYDDVRIRPNSGFARSRDGGAYYAQSWEAAIASSPNWVVITSFNEWPEGSYIEPSANYGDAYLGLTAQYGGQYRSGGGAALVAAPAPQPAPPSADAAEQAAGEGAPQPAAEPAAEPAAQALTEPDTPTVFVQAAILNLRQGPGAGFASIGAVVEGDALPILGQSALSDGETLDGFRWWQVDTIAGPAWVYGEYVRAAGPLESVPLVEIAAAAPSVETPAPAAIATPLATPTPSLSAAPAPITQSSTVTRVVAGAGTRTVTSTVTSVVTSTVTTTQSSLLTATVELSIFDLRPARGSR